MSPCSCHRTSDRDIICAVRESPASLDELQDRTLVATSRRAGHDRAPRHFNEHAAAGGAGVVRLAVIVAAKAGG